MAACDSDVEDDARIAWLAISAVLDSYGFDGEILRK